MVRRSPRHGRWANINDRLEPRLSVFRAAAKVSFDDVPDLMYPNTMFGPLRKMLVVALLMIGLLLPKVSALALHLNPNIMAIVICTGTEMVTIHIGADGQPMEVAEAEQAACVLSDPNAIANRAFALWTLAPRSYRATFVENASSLRSEAEVGLLADLRGPPFVI